jgi:hypothetical protein
LEFYESSESHDHLNTLKFSRMDVMLVDSVFNVTSAMLQSQFQVAGSVGCATDVTELEPRATESMMAV